MTYDLDALRAWMNAAHGHLMTSLPVRAFEQALREATPALLDDAALGRAVQDEDRVARLIFEHVCHYFPVDRAQRFTFDELQGAADWCRAAARALIAMGGK